MPGRQFEKPYFPKLVIKDPLVFRKLLDLHLQFEQNASTLEHESEFISTMALLLTRHTKNNYSFQVSKKEPHYVATVRDYLSSHTC